MDILSELKFLEIVSKSVLKSGELHVLDVSQQPMKVLIIKSTQKKHVLVKHYI